MSENEKLREALFELEQVRAHSEQKLAQSEAILHGLEQVTLARSPREALDALLRSVLYSIKCDAAALFEVKGNDCKRVATTNDRLGSGENLDADYISSRPLHVSDINLVAGKLEDLHCNGRYTEVLTVPSAASDGICHVLACLCETAGRLTKTHLKIAERLVSLAVQSIEVKKLADENALLAEVINNSSASFSIADADDPDQKLIYVNRAFEQLTGYSSEEATGSNCRFLSAEPADSETRAALREAVKQKAAGTFELVNKRKSGEIFWNHLNLYPVETGSGEYLVATQWDLTARVLAEQERDAAHEQLVSALSSAREAILLLDHESRLVFANRQYLSMHQIEGVEFEAGQLFGDFWRFALEASGKSQADSEKLAKEKLERLTNRHFQSELKMPNGVQVLETIADTSVGGTVCVLTDVTPLKVAQQQLAERAAAMEAVQDGIAIIDEDGRFVYLNPSKAQLFGYRSPTELIGRKWSCLFGSKAMDFIEARAIPMVKRRGKWRGDIDGVMKDATPVRLEISLTRFGEIGLIATVRSIEERLRAEAERTRLQQQLNDAQRQEAIGQMAAGLAHDFNNCLSVISGTASLLSDEAFSDAVVDNSNRILLASKRAAELTRRLLNFGTRSSLKKRVDIRQETEAAIDLVKYSVRSDTELVSSMPQEALQCLLDKTEFHQVLVNLVMNAQDAIEVGPGRIDVSLAESAGDQTRTPIRGHLRPGKTYAKLSVSDNGIGIDTGDIETLFEPYISTKTASGGTGLGLAVVQSIVLSNGGAIDVHSTKHMGTTFHVFWPLESSQIAEEDTAKAEPEAEPLPGTSVLVLDDDIEVAETLAGLLEKMGCEVIVCDDPNEALEVLKADQAYWDLAITDFDMPQMNGAEFARKLQNFTVKVPLVLCTALPEYRGEVRGEGVFAGRLSKPVDPEQLLQMVHQIVRKSADENLAG